MKEKVNSPVQNNTKPHISTHTIWAERRDIPLAILAWVVLIASIIWLLGHISSAIFLLIIAAFLGYALAPTVNFFQKVMPRSFAIIFVYLILLSAFGILIFMIISTAVYEVTTLVSRVSLQLTPHGSEGSTQVTILLHQFGLTQNDLNTMKEQLTYQVEQLTGSILPFLSSIVTFILDILLVAMISIYFLIDGGHIIHWLRENTPASYSSRTIFLLNTMERIVGGYIKGQIFLSGLIGLLVGFGLFVFHVPFAVLLGVLAFILEFIPYLGTLISGAISILVALTQGWVIALAVLIYFILIHVIESDFVGPRIVAKAVGLHPLVAIIALIIGGELYGIAGALFASPIAGVSQAILISVWQEWKRNHPEEFKINNNHV